MLLQKLKVLWVFVRMFEVECKEGKKTLNEGRQVEMYYIFHGKAVIGCRVNGMLHVNCGRPQHAKKNWHVLRISRRRVSELQQEVARWTVGFPWKTRSY